MASLTPRLDSIQAQAQNLIINGGMDLWQRGTSVSVGSSVTQYQADRFIVRRDFGNAPTYSQSTDTPTALQSGYKSAFSLLLTNNATGTAPTGTQSMFIQYRMEGFDYQSIHAQKVRLQFWVKSSVTGTYSVFLGSGLTNRSYVTTYTISVANTWEKKTIDIQLDTVDSNFSYDNTASLQIGWALSTGATRQTSSLNTWSDTFFTGSTTDTNTWSSTNSATFRLAQVSLIQADLTSAGASTVDMPFKRAGRTIADELKMAERYYQLQTFDNFWIGRGVTDSGTPNAYYGFRTTMRAAPSGSASNFAINSGTAGPTGFSAPVAPSTNSIRIVCSGTASSNYTLISGNLSLDAEL